MKAVFKYILFAVISILILVSTLFVISKRKSKEIGIRDLPEISKEGVIHVVTDYNPVGYYVEDDTIAGFNYDLIKLLEKYTTLKIEISLESSLNNSLLGLEKNTYDIIARNVPITTELRDSIGFTEPISQNKQVLIQRKKEFNNDIELIKSHIDLAKKTLYVPKNSPAILRIKNLSREIGDTIYIKEDDLYEAEHLAMQVASGDIDYAVCDENVIKKIAKALPEIDYSTFIGFTHFEAWVVRKNSPILLDSLNTWLKKIKQTKKYSGINRKYNN